MQIKKMKINISKEIKKMYKLKKWKWKFKNLLNKKKWIEFTQIKKMYKLKK